MTENSLTVVGAGPVGLIAALAFARQGVQVTVLEAALEVNMSPRAMVYLSPVLVDLDRYGILDDMKERGFIDHEGFNMHLVELGEVLRAPNTVIEGFAHAPFNVHMGQGQLCEIVLEHLAKLPNVTVHWGAGVTGLEQDETGVTLTTTDAAGETRTVRSAWVIGADGGRSAVRGLIGATLEGTTWAERFVATNVRYDFRSMGMSSSNLFVHPTLPAVIAQINQQGLWRCTFQESVDLPEEQIEHRIADYFEALLGEGADYELVSYSPYRMHQRLSTQLRQGRVMLAGDAAHLTNPTGGMGLTGGLYDVFALEEALLAVMTGASDDSILDRWAEARSAKFTEFSSPTASFLKDLVYGSHDAETLRLRTEPIRVNTATIDTQRAMLLGLDGGRSASLLAPPAS
jgi:3-(3-hydroxy-phenyl)propionate hydroxylase